MAVIKSGITSDLLTIDPISKAARATIYNSDGREISFQGKPTFMASGIFTPPATPSDMVKVTGSASKIIRVTSFKITTTNTAAGSQQFSLIKRSADDIAGTFVPATAVPLDSINGAATAIIGHYTVNPTSLGAAVGTLNIVRVASPAAIPASFAGIVQDAGYDLLNQNQNALLNKLVTLRGAAQILALNFGGAALVAGQTHTYRITWIEE